jgi:hypothetical protein
MLFEGTACFEIVSSNLTKYSALLVFTSTAFSHSRLSKALNIS